MVFLLQVCSGGGGVLIVVLFGLVNMDDLAWYIVIVESDKVIVVNNVSLFGNQVIRWMVIFFVDDLQWIG